MGSEHTNHLIHEKSPYLLQHAHNPVDWYPWGEEAFRLAREQDKPIFLSIGYATCHWCHVMERESFENNSIAAFLNEHFVSIKVDREERPDVDMLYMSAVQAMTGQGGWPLSVFLTPDLKPFYGGTYFPPEPRYGRPGFLTLLHSLAQAWQTRRDEIEKYAGEMHKILSRELAETVGDSTLSPQLLNQAFASYAAEFDSVNGGFGGAPKFPRPMDVQFLLRYYHATGNRAALQMARVTLDKMAAGGIYDQIGGGFHRYATDAQWLIPHFEKMLYDNALLAIAYTEAVQVTGDSAYAAVVDETLAFVQREMTAPSGAFYSALDADSEGEEGKFYLWHYEELRRLLSAEEFQTAEAVFSLHPEGNFENSSIILHRRGPLRETAAQLGISEQFLRNRLAAVRERLLKARGERIRPLTDDKVLTSWNALMISGFARAAMVLGRSDYRQTAVKACHFLLEKMLVNGELLHRFREGSAEISGLLEDYAFFIQALLDLFELTFETKYLYLAYQLANKTIQLFGDHHGAGFFVSSKEQKDLPVRQKDSYDGAIPSGNSMMAMNLLRLAEYNNNLEWRELAENLLKTYSRRVQQHPLSFAQMLLAMDFRIRGARELVFASPNHSMTPVAPFLEVFAARYHPNSVWTVVTEENRDLLKTLIPWSADRPALKGKGTVYICQNFTCKRPVTTVNDFLLLLEESGFPGRIQ